MKLLLLLATVACASVPSSPEPPPQTSIEIPTQTNTAVTTGAVIEAAVRAGYKIESTYPGVVNLAPKDLATQQRVSLRANITNDAIVVSGTFTDQLLHLRNDVPITIVHWYGGREAKLWAEVENFAAAIRNINQE